MANIAEVISEVKRIPEGEGSSLQLFCTTCQKIVPPKLTKTGRHLRADCPNCKKYIQFVSPKKIPTLQGSLYEQRRIQRRSQLLERVTTLAQAEGPSGFWHRAQQFLRSIGTKEAAKLTEAQFDYLTKLERSCLPPVIH